MIALALFAIGAGFIVLCLVASKSKPTKIELEEREEDWSWPERHAGPKRERLP